MTDTTNFGDVELDLVARLGALKPDLLGLVAAASTEGEADKMTKAFAAAVFVMQPITILRYVAIQQGKGKFATEVQARWTLYHYSTTGKATGEARYGAAGVFALGKASRDRMGGYTPQGQINNIAALIYEGEALLEPYGSTGALKLAAYYSLKQLFHWDVT